MACWKVFGSDRSYAATMVEEYHLSCLFPNSKEQLDSRTLLVAKCGAMDTPQISIPNGRAMLAQFIRQRTTQAKFARDVGCSESHLSLVLSGSRGVSFALAKRISKATGGKIPVSVLPHEAAEAAE